MSIFAVHVFSDGKHEHIITHSDEQLIIGWYQFSDGPSGNTWHWCMLQGRRWAHQCFLTVSESWGLRSTLRKRNAKTGTIHIAVANAIVNHTTGCSNVLWALPVLTNTHYTNTGGVDTEFIAFHKHCKHTDIRHLYTMISLLVWNDFSRWLQLRGIRYYWIDHFLTWVQAITMYLQLCLRVSGEIMETNHYNQWAHVIVRLGLITYIISGSGAWLFYFFLCVFDCIFLIQS